MDRITLTVHENGTATARGIFTDSRDNRNSLNRTYATEQQARQEFHDMRERGAEFSYTINRKA